jgi:hypothetical protein
MPKHEDFVFFDLCCEPADQQGHDLRKIGYSSHTATTDDHSRPPPSGDAPGHRRAWPIRHPQASSKLFSAVVAAGRYW